MAKTGAENRSSLAVKIVGVVVSVAAIVVAVALAFGGVKSDVYRNCDRLSRHGKRIEVVERKQDDMVDTLAEIRADIKVLIERTEKK